MCFGKIQFRLTIRVCQNCGLVYWQGKYLLFSSVIFSTLYINVLKDGWSYLEKLNQFIDGGGIDADFLEQVSRIVTRSFRGQYICGNAISSGERHAKFRKSSIIFNLRALKYQTTNKTVMPSPTKTSIFLPTAKIIHPFIVLPTAEPTGVPTILTNPQLVSISENTVNIHMAQNPPSTHLTERVMEGNTTCSSSSSPHNVPSQTMPFSVSKNSYELTSEELANCLSRQNSYCASSKEEVYNTCATSSGRLL